MNTGFGEMKFLRSILGVSQANWLRNNDKEYYNFYTGLVDDVGRMHENRIPKENKSLLQFHRVQKLKKIKKYF